MIELLKDFPDYVAAYKATGMVNSGEYERIVMSRVDEVASKFDGINFLVKLETGVEEYSLKSVLDYLKISFKHIHRWNRMAIVSDQETVREFYDALSPLVPGKVAGFELDEFDKAKAWVSEPFLADENVLRQDWKTIIAAGIVATGAMTLFSHIISKTADENYSEPNHLGSVIHRANPGLYEAASKALGWQAHFAIGTAWSALYNSLRNKKHRFASSILFGCFSGLTGILMWKKIFDRSPDLSRVEYKNFYLQLFFAHVVFGLTLEKTTSLLKR